MTRRQTVLVLAAAMLAASALLVYLGRGLTPVVDQWAYISAYQGWKPSTLLTPHNGHLVVFPLVIEKVIAEVFGLESQLPFQLLNVALSATVAALLFALIRDAVGGLLALAASVLILFYGAGADVLVPTFQISNLTGLCGGLAALLALRREDLRGDLAACIFLGVSLASFSIGIAFLVGAVVALALRPPGRRMSRAWVVLLPAVLYGAWTLWAHKFGQQHLYAHNLKILGSALMDQGGAALSALTGLFTTPNGPPPEANPVPIRTTWGPVLVAGLAVLAFVRLRRAPRPGANALIAASVLVAYFLLVGIALNQFRNTFDTRLVYLGSVLMLLAVAELCAPYRPSRAVLAGVGAVFVFSFCANVAELGDSAQFWRAQSSLNRAKLGAVEIAGPEAAGEVLIEDPPEAMTFPVEQFHELDAKFGMPAYSEAELLDASPRARRAADRELARVLELEPEAVPRLRALRAIKEGVGVGKVMQGSARPRHACAVLLPGSDGSFAVRLELPPGGLSFASASPPQVRLGRFGEVPVVRLAAPAGPVVVPIPVDLGATPWYASLRGSEPTLACPVGGLA